MKMRMCKNNRGGFTLAETLIAVLILLMVTGIVAAGIPAASNALNRAVDASHAQLLLSTTMTSLRNELGSARSIDIDAVSEEDEEGEESGEPGDEPVEGTGPAEGETEEPGDEPVEETGSAEGETEEETAQGPTIHYVDSSGAQCVLESKPDGIYVTKEASPESAAGDWHPGIPTKLLVSQQAATSNLYAAFRSATYENGIVKIVGLRVCKKLQDGSEQVLSDLEDVAFEIEVIGRKG